MAWSQSQSRVPILAYGARLPTRDVVVLRRRETSGLWSVLRVITERFEDRGVILAVEALDVDPEGLRGIHRRIYEASQGLAGPMPVEQARTIITRAVLLDRALGHPLAEPLTQEHGWLAPWDALVGGVNHLYTCQSCGDGLPGGWQLARVRKQLSREEARDCPLCSDDEEVLIACELYGEPHAVAMAHVMLACDEPRRALVFVSRALDKGTSPESTAGVRGAAHLSLGNAVQAAVYLRVAVSFEPNNVYWRTRLVEAEARCGLISSALGNLDAIALTRPACADAVQSAREALSPYMLAPSDALGAYEVRCLEALALLDAGRAVEARNRLADLEPVNDDAPAARLTRIALAARGPRPATSAATQWTDREMSPILSGPLAVLRARLA